MEKQIKKLEETLIRFEETEQRLLEKINNLENELKSYIEASTAKIIKHLEECKCNDEIIKALNKGKNDKNSYFPDPKDIPGTSEEEPREKERPRFVFGPHIYGYNSEPIKPWWPTGKPQ